MNILLTADLHLTDNPIELYRWKIFDDLKILAKKHKVGMIIFLGDCWDRKDRHSAKLVNKVIEYLSDLVSQNTEVIILSGNHDQPISGPYYWEFLNELGIEYITKPTIDGTENIWLLPFSANPLEDWKDLKLADAKAIMMHQTIQGAMVDGDRTIPSTPHPLPNLPTIPIFSGDVHRPQETQGITYVGTPHPVRFSETWKNRVILIENNDFKNFKSIWLDSTQRAIIDIQSLDELLLLKYNKDDQIRIRYKLSAEKLTDWSLEQSKIQEWARERGVHLASIEPILQGEGLKPTSEEEKTLELMKPDEIIRLFSEDEKLSEDIIEMGLELLREAQ